MKICFPVSENKGLESIIYNHFGSAPMFLLVDGNQRTVEQIFNRDVGQRHGACRPLKAFRGHQVDTIVVGGIGSGILLALIQAGVKVYQSTKGTIADNLDNIMQKEMELLSSEQTCGGYQSHCCGCNHNEPCGF